MSAGRHDLVIKQGTDFVFRMRIKDSLGVPSDLTGFTFKMQIRKKPESTTLLAEGVFALDDQTTSNGKGWVQFTFSRIVTAAIPVSSMATPDNMDAYWYDVFSDSGSLVECEIEGVAYIDPRITV